ncbi:MAG: hypothetical protein WBP87_12360 [Candidatus Sulfotelmatobacter sp.]
MALGKLSRATFDFLVAVHRKQVTAVARNETQGAHKTGEPPR